MTPEQAPDQAPNQADGGRRTITSPPQIPQRNWQHRLLRICFTIFAFEVGLFLVIFPWMDETWSINYFQDLVPMFQNIWQDPYFRGALTGLGFVNLYIACQELIRLLRRV